MWAVAHQTRYARPVASDSELPDEPSADEPTGGDVAAQLALTAARGLAVAGRFVGRKLASAFLAIDPDVRRHVAQVPLMTYTLLASRSVTVEPGEPDGHPPLVFVHGFGGSRGDFLLMAGYLHLRGRKRRYAIEFESGQSIEQKARALAELVREVVRVTGEPKVDVVAHSLGGVITRVALVDHALAPLLRRVITLGSPHHGTVPARYSSSLTTIELRPNSALLARLAQSPWPDEVHGVSFWSKGDVIILPHESAALPGTDQIEVTPFTHLSYLVDPRSWMLVSDELSRS